MFKLLELKYSYDALEPYIDRETMEVHHQGHHAAYFNKLNKILEKYDVSNRTLEDIIKNLNNKQFFYSYNNSIFNNIV